MNSVLKFFLLGLGSVGMLVATVSESEAGCRHRRHRHHGHCASQCAPAPSSCCNTGYAAPVANSCCNVGVYSQQAHTAYGYSDGQAPQMAPSGQASPSDMPAGAQPPAPPAPGAAPPPPAAQ